MGGGSGGGASGGSTGGFDWSKFGKSMQTTGDSMGNYSTPSISSSTSGGTQTQQYGANPLPFTMIPESQGGGDIVAILQRLLGGG